MYEISEVINEKEINMIYTSHLMADAFPSKSILSTQNLQTEQQIN